MSLPESNWRRRDWLAAVFLFAASAAFVLWQNSRVAVLWDLAYLLDSSWRMALGQMPYRDFPFVHPPGTFLIQAALMRLFGRHYLLSVAWAATAGGMGTLLAWRIIVRVLRDWYAALALAAPLVAVGLYAVYPHPIYDGDCVLAVLLAVWMLSQAADSEERGDSPALRQTKPQAWRARHPRVWAVAAGVAATLPVWFKQNIGFAFVAAVVACALAAWVAARFAPPAAESQGAARGPGAGEIVIWVLLGAVAAVGAGLAILACTAGFANYFQWTVRFAAQRRMPGFAPMVEMYRDRSLLWMFPATLAGVVLLRRPLSTLNRRANRLGASGARAVGCALLLAPWAWCAAQFVLLADDADSRADALLELWPVWLLTAAAVALFDLRKGVTFRRLMPLALLAAVHGTFLSQQLWGSTYALWPLLTVLIASVLAWVPGGRWPLAAAAAVGSSLLVCGGLYAASLERLSYIGLPHAPPDHARTPALRGMADSGPYLANLDELVRFANRQIPPGEPLLMLPGEDPFYFATGRTPQFPILLMDPATDPYGARELLAEAERRRVRWVIVKRVLQVRQSPMPEAEETLRLVEQRYPLCKRLAGYDVYCTKQGTGT